mmetsp:Transcript_20471/g.30325  ORF Transcript_20471/g.30325 Transcript_20471/m.30325 type:complete len:213 (-) Transcript_20471:206-844(-)
MSQFGCVVALAWTIRGSFLHSSNSSSFEKSRNAPPEAVKMMRRSPPSGTPCKHWKMAECSESAASMLTPYFSIKGKITGPPLISVSLFAKAISFLSLMASMVGSRPAAPTIPVTTVSAESTVAAARIPSSPCRIFGMFLHPAPSNLSLSSFAASAVDKEATFGLYFSTCSAMSSALFPADSASTTKLSGQASTISRVCVPMLPVEPNSDSLF